MNYSKKPLGEICKFEYGKSLSDKIRIPGKVNVYGSNGIVGSHTESYTSGKTIIVGRKGSIGEVEMSNEACWPIDTTYYIDISCTDCDLDWLAYMLKYLKLGELNKASGVPGLNRDDAYNKIVTVPELISDQRQIATHIKAQLAEVEKAQKAVESQVGEIQNLANAIIYESIRYANTKRHKLGDVLREIKKGIGESWEDYPVLGATRNGLALAKEPPGKTPQRYKPVVPGTVFYNPMRILIGSIAFVDDDDPPGITSPDYVVLQGEEGLLDSRWFYYWLRSPLGEQCISSLARGAVRERMLFNRLAEGEIELPEFSIQKKASESLKELVSIKKVIKQQMDDIKVIPNKLLAQAFKIE